MTNAASYFSPIARKRLLRVVSLLLTLAAINLMPIHSFAMTSLTDSQRNQLDNGEVLVEVKQEGTPPKGMVEATILIDAPAEAIWSIMLDCDAVPTFVPGVNACKVLSAGSDWEIIEHDVKWAWLFPEITYVFRADYQKYRRIDFIRTEGDLKEMMGHWSLHPVDGGEKTIVCYSVYLDPGFLVPQWLVRYSLKNDLPEVLRALRTQVDGKN